MATRITGWSKYAAITGGTGGTIDLSKTSGDRGTVYIDINAGWFQFKHPNGAKYVFLESNTDPVGRNHEKFDRVDNVVSSKHDTFVNGSNNDNFIKTSHGDDVIVAWGGNDTIDPGRGTNVVTGGSGADTFILGAGKSHTTITDYEHGVDTLVFVYS